VVAAYASDFGRVVPVVVFGLRRHRQRGNEGIDPAQRGVSAGPAGIAEPAAGTECPDGGACMDRYGVSPEQWGGWFERDGCSLTATGRPDSA
jgi:hypothetical protein